MRAANIRTLIITRMGQFLIGEELELDYIEFLRLITEALGSYSEYRPRLVTTNINIPYTFNSDPAPLWISNVEFIGNGIDKYEWDYDEETHYLYCLQNGVITGGGAARVQAAYPYQLIYQSNGSDDPYWDIPYINESKDELLFQLILGLTLVSLGTSRDSFTLNDLPISNNASELRSTGENIISETTQRLKESHQKFYTGWSLH